MLPRAWLAAALLVFAAASTDCADTTDGGAEFGAPCETASDCASDICLDPADQLGQGGICSQDCEIEPCPQGFACAVGLGGAKRCVVPCTNGDTGDYACLDGVPVPCALDDGAGCKWCGCSSGEHCVVDSGCEPKRQLGEACFGHDWCESDNCGAPASGGDGICLVPVWDPCQDDNCATCIQESSESFCTRECSSGGCPEGFMCVTRSLDEPYLCTPRCAGDSECPPNWFCGTIADTPQMACLWP